ncbi:MAG TPA: S8 family serine peptidase, partial [Spongiibacteraceae bacterium]|nr:S8 family serine peptidase [Spongiibacteraceae bacterium]
MKKIILLLCVSVFGSLITASTQAAPDPDQARQQIAPRLQHLRDIAQQRQKVRVIAQLRSTGSGTHTVQIDNSRRALRTLLAKRNIQALSEFTEFPLAVYSVSATELDTLIDSGLVEQVAEDAVNFPTTLTSAVQFVKGNVPRSLGYTGSGATIAILDTGVDSTHPDFAGRVVAEACYSTNDATQGVTSLCPGAVTSKTGTGSAVPCPASLSWACEHGTHVAAIAAGSNATSPGIAPAAKIVAVQVFSQSTNATTCGGTAPCIVAYDSNVLSGLSYIYSLRNTVSLKTIAAVNLSLGGGQFTANCDTSTYKTPIDSLRSANIATVIASGNNGYTNAVNAPGCVSTAITVGSVADPSGVVSSWSNSLIGLLDILAPGENINAAIPGGGYATLSGTSMATPFVTGAFAILKGINTADTMASMEARLKTYSTPQVDSRNGGTFPRLNLELVTANIVGSSQLPTIAINSPANNSKLAFDKKPFALSATATDPQDGNLNASVKWASSKDGVITTPANLSLGSHTLTASVTDSTGFTKSASVNVSVLNAPTAAITAPTAGLQQLSSVPFTFTATASDIENGNLSA